jgi:hypothetical protein
MFDLIILGGGPAGYRAAERAAQAGLRVCLFEKRAMGGVCLHEGCIPSKALLYSAKLFESVGGSAKPYGVSYEKASLDYRAAVRHKDKVVKSLADGIETALKALHVTIIREHAQIEGKDGNGFRVGGQRGKNCYRQAANPSSAYARFRPLYEHPRDLRADGSAKTLAIIGGGADRWKWRVFSMRRLFHNVTRFLIKYGSDDARSPGCSREHMKKRVSRLSTERRLGDNSEQGATPSFMRRKARRDQGHRARKIGVYWIREPSSRRSDKTNVPVYSAEALQRHVHAATRPTGSRVSVHTILGKKTSCGMTDPVGNLYKP